MCVCVCRLFYLCVGGSACSVLFIVQSFNIEARSQDWYQNKENQALRAMMWLVNLVMLIFGVAG